MSMAQIAPTTESALQKPQELETAQPLGSRPAIPVLLLKTKSSPTDAYEELFASAPVATDDGPGAAPGFEPIFVPVLEYRFDDDGVTQLRDLLVRREIKSCRHKTGRSYGGVIFTSQRAVEAFARVVKEGSKGEKGETLGDPETQVQVPDELLSGEPDDTAISSWPHLHDVPVYSVGPATTRALKAVAQDPPLQVHGDHTGNGEDLAHFIREHYTEAHHPLAKSAPRPLLFVVGEKRRDIIPKVLMGHGKDDSEGGEQTQKKIPVDELVVYGTGVMESFFDDFQQVLKATQDRPVRWAVVFSPTGCDSLLSCLGMLDPETGRARDQPASKNSHTTYVATIGPTTRTYLRETFDFEPDVCAEQPTPAGVLRGIRQFMENRDRS